MPQRTFGYVRECHPLASLPILRTALAAKRNLAQQGDRAEVEHPQPSLEVVSSAVSSHSGSPGFKFSPLIKQITSFHPSHI